MMLVLAAANKANEAGKYKKTVITTDAGVMATGGPLCSVGDSWQCRKQHLNQIQCGMQAGTHVISHEVVAVSCCLKSMER